MRLKHGHSLAEALCALALGGVLAAAAGLMLGSARRALEESEMKTVGGRAEREAVAIVRKALAAGESIVLHGDTAVELDLLIGASVLCGSESRALLLPPLRSAASMPLSAVPQLPSADDVVLVRRFDGSADGVWWYGVVDSVVQRRLPHQCRSEDGWRAPADSAADLIRIVLADTVPVDLEPGAEVRVFRRGRFALYHIGRGEWAVGWRRCHPWNGACGTIQPVAAPLRAPGARGFRVVAVDRSWALAAHGVGGRGRNGHGALVSRRGIALPIVLLVLVALGMLSSLALSDALLASRVAALAESELRARAAALAGDSLVRHPPDVAWLCLQPPSSPVRRVLVLPAGERVEVLWWMAGPGLVRVQVLGVSPDGGRHRRLGWLRPDSLLPLDPRPGCPDAQALVPAAENWRAAHPEG